MEPAGVCVLREQKTLKCEILVRLLLLINVNEKLHTRGKRFAQRLTLKNCGEKLYLLRAAVSIALILAGMGVYGAVWGFSVAYLSTITLIITPMALALGAFSEPLVRLIYGEVYTLAPEGKLFKNIGELNGIN